MLKIFRTIRKRLIEQQNARKYLLYATGEILLVVIGILIALQINNWNETRKHHISEREFWAGINNDLIDDKIFIEFVLSRIEPKIEAFNQMNNEVEWDFTDDRDDIDRLLGNYLFVGQQTFYPISGSFQSAVSGNEINTYKNKVLIRSIVKLYHSTYPRLVENGQMLDERWGLLSEKYSRERRRGRFDQMNSSELSRILDDVHFHFIQMQWYQSTLTSSLEEIDRILTWAAGDLDEQPGERVGRADTGDVAATSDRWAGRRWARSDSWSRQPHPRAVQAFSSGQGEPSAARRVAAGFP